MNLTKNMNPLNLTTRYQKNELCSYILYLDSWIVCTMKNRLYTKKYRKKNSYTFLNIISEHPKSLKSSIPHRQAL